MAKRKSLNIRSSRFNKSSIGSGELNPDTNVLDEKEVFWWKDLENNTIARPSIANSINETSAYLNASSSLDGSPTKKNWWKLLEDTNIPNTSKSMKNKSTNITDSKISSLISESEIELEIPKKKRFKRIKARRSIGNAFFDALHSSTKNSILSERVQKSGNEISMDSYALRSRASNNWLTQSELEQSHSTDNILKTKPKIFQNRLINESKNAFDEVFQDSLTEKSATKIIVENKNSTVISEPAAIFGIYSKDEDSCTLSERLKNLDKLQTKSITEYTTNGRDSKEKNTRNSLNKKLRNSQQLSTPRENQITQFSDTSSKFTPSQNRSGPKLVIATDSGKLDSEIDNPKNRRSNRLRISKNQSTLKNHSFAVTSHDSDQELNISTELAKSFHQSQIKSVVAPVNDKTDSKIANATNRLSKSLSSSQRQSISKNRSVILDPSRSIGEKNGISVTSTEHSKSSNRVQTELVAAPVTDAADLEINNVSNRQNKSLISSQRRSISRNRSVTVDPSRSIGEKNGISVTSTEHSKRSNRVQTELVAAPVTDAADLEINNSTNRGSKSLRSSQGRSISRKHSIDAEDDISVTSTEHSKSSKTNRTELVTAPVTDTADLEINNSTNRGRSKSLRSSQGRSISRKHSIDAEDDISITSTEHSKSSKTNRTELVTAPVTDTADLEINNSTNRGSKSLRTSQGRSISRKHFIDAEDDISVTSSEHSKSSKTIWTELITAPVTDTADSEINNSTNRLSKSLRTSQQQSISRNGLVAEFSRRSMGQKDNISLTAPQHSKDSNRPQTKLVASSDTDEALSEIDNDTRRLRNSLKTSRQLSKSGQEKETALSSDSEDPRNQFSLSLVKKSKTSNRSQTKKYVSDTDESLEEENRERKRKTLQWLSRSEKRHFGVLSSDSEDQFTLSLAEPFTKPSRFQTKLVDSSVINNKDSNIDNVINRLRKRLRTSEELSSPEKPQDASFSINFKDKDDEFIFSLPDHSKTSSELQNKSIAVSNTKQSNSEALNLRDAFQNLSNSPLDALPSSTSYNKNEQSATNQNSQKTISNTRKVQIPADIIKQKSTLNLDKRKTVQKKLDEFVAPVSSPSQMFADQENLKEVLKKMDEIKKKETVLLKVKLTAAKKKVPSQSKNLNRSKTILKHQSVKKINEAYLVNGKVYKVPRLPRPKRWVTDRLYQHIWTRMEPKYKLETRVRSEKFVRQLSDVTSYIQKCKKYSSYKTELKALMMEMAHLGIIRTRKDFHHFCQEFLPYEIREKTMPILLPGNKLTIPYNPDKLDVPLLKS